MIDEQVILTAQRLRGEIDNFRQLLRDSYRAKTSQVGSSKHREQAARLAEVWLVELAVNPEFGIAIGAPTLADLNVNFQRLLTFSEHATVRSRYDAELRAIFNNYATRVVLPLKQARGRTLAAPLPTAPVKTIVHSAFVGQSFSVHDRRVNDCVATALAALGIKAVTGEKPRASSISDKVKKLIEEQNIFVGVFTRREKISRKAEWTTSAWVIDEKAYALGRGKRLVLLKEEGVGSIGGIQGDYEYLEFSRDQLETLAIKLVLLFDLENKGLRD